MSCAFVFCGGEPVSVKRISGLGVPHLVVAADSGALLALEAGLKIDLLVGDLDSIPTPTLAHLRREKTEIDHRPRDKDATDLSVALSAVVRQGAETITVIGGGGGRMDHLLGNVAVICSPGLADKQITWVTSAETAYPVHGRHAFFAQPEKTISVLAVGGQATGVSLSGLHWELSEVALSPFSSLGISNRAVGGSVTVEVSKGTLLVVVNEAQI